MQIFILSHYGNGGCEFTFAKAVNEAGGHQARAARWDANYLDFDFDILGPTPEDIAELWEWADVVTLIDFGDPGSLARLPEGLPKRPLLKVYTGTGYREHFRAFNVIDSGLGAIQAAVTLDLCQRGPAWLPLPVDDLSDKYDPDPNVFRVAQAPTNRAVKSTDHVVRELGKMPGWELIEFVDNATCLARKSRLHLLIDQFHFGYGTNAAEAWAFGYPVVADADDWILGAIEREMGYLPFVRPMGNLKATVTRLRDDPDFYEFARKRGRTCWQEYHAPAKVAARLVALAERAAG
jgi:hypothetical protein